MIRIGLAAGATRLQVSHAHFRGSRTVYFESAPGETPGPQAFLVEQPPDFHLATHYHRQEQFQVVLRGSGTLASHALAPGAVHYSSREAGYGPIVSGPDGLDYLTLRLVTEIGAQYLPEARAGLRRGLRKGHATAQATLGAHEADASGTHAATAAHALIDPRADGLAAWHTHIPADTHAAPPGPAAGAGRFLVVVAGTARLGETLLPRGTAICALRDETALEFHAVDGPVDLLTLQFPEGADHDDYAAWLTQQRDAMAAPV